MTSYRRARTALKKRQREKRQRKRAPTAIIILRLEVTGRLPKGKRRNNRRIYCSWMGLIKKTRE